MRINLKNLMATSAAIAFAAAALSTGVVQAQNEDWPQSVSIGTATIGGTMYIYGSGWASIIEDVVGVNASVENTGGPVANATLVNQGELELGRVTVGPAFLAWTGEAETTPGLEHKNMRALFPMFETPLQVVNTGGTPLSALTDLKGRTIGAGSATGTASFLMPRVMETLEFDATLRHASWGDLSRQLGDGMLDAVTYTAGMPVPALMELEATQSINLYSLSEEEREQLVAEHPFLANYTIPGGTYSTVEDDVNTVAIWNYAIAHKDLPDDLVYEIVKAVFENNDRMVTAHAAAASTHPEHVYSNNFMWFHPGAIRYYEEAGFEIPENLVPPADQ